MVKRFAPAVALLGLCIVACAGGGGPAADTPTAPANNPAGMSARALVESLRQSGLTVSDAGMVQQPFFTVPAQVYMVEGRDLQTYEFASAAEAEAAASKVAPSGSPIGTSMVTWMDAPHFFRKDRLIVNYVGSSEKALAELQRLLGPQFAGRQ